MIICSGIDAVSGSGIEIQCDGEAIREVWPAMHAPANWIAPGWVDIQVNGFAGVDYNSPNTSHEEIARSVQVLYSAGVTRFYPTVITGGPDDMVGALRNLARAKDSLPEGAAMDGFHVEGPHISPDDGPRGAHPKRWVRPPDIDEFCRWQDATGGRIRLVTLAPEWPGAPRYIEAVTSRNVVVSIGHTNAEARHIADAVSAGATMSTHLGNGAHAVMRRHPNYIWEQLAEDRLRASFIVDGIHLPTSFLKVALRAKGLERALLVTDASSPAGCKPGRYRLGEQDVDLTPDNRVVLAGQERLAGSALRMDRGVENLMRLGELSLADAVRLATVNAARAGRVPGRERGLVDGDRADFVLFDFDEGNKAIQVKATYVGGRKVWSV
ncbi:MAG TPA: N-acetylglucosamine-6-phosphate deacetylase [Bryobacteraceae bacterium]|nr:N-acetylglucosamine-6-phosphate deacetylase [Bryobacteraceae bacterium]